MYYTETEAPQSQARTGFAPGVPRFIFRCNGTPAGLPRTVPLRLGRRVCTTPSCTATVHELDPTLREPVGGEPEVDHFKDFAYPANKARWKKFTKQVRGGDDVGVKGVGWLVVWRKSYWCMSGESLFQLRTTMCLYERLSDSDSNIYIHAEQIAHKIIAATVTHSSYTDGKVVPRPWVACSSRGEVKRIKCVCHVPGRKMVMSKNTPNA